ncbi:MAG: O-antigen ligase C-terminal domain-containing protein [Nitrosomonadales bacterium]|nr:O-antigen ligase C-terminal domain-containing protein [Nitrosomonadales bacterium]
MWVFPFLHYRHENPLTTFDQEWWSAMLGIFALTFLVAREFWQQPEAPRIAQLPIALIAVVLLQVAVGKVAYFNQALLFSLYFLFAALLMVLGAKLRDNFGLPRLAQILATFLVAGTALSATIGVLQHFQWHTPLDAFIATKVSPLLYGNIAQHNHFADYTAMGLVSLGLLFQQGKLKTPYVAVLAGLLLLVMSLSGSRSSWLYLLMISGLAWWCARRDEASRPLLRYSLMLLAGFGVMHFVVQQPFMAGVNSTNTVERLVGHLFSDDAGQSSTVWMKFYMWREAGLMLMQSPWLGVGFGQFAWHHFQLLPEFRVNYMFGLYNNAHNLIFQLAAEAGIAGLLALFGSLGIWLYGLRSVKLSAAHWWGYAVLGVLAIHSLLEYPLWYAYFLAIAAILLGAFDETRYRIKLQKAGRLSMALILLMGLVTLIQWRGSYMQLKDTLSIRLTTDNAAEVYPLIRKGLMVAHDGTLVSPYAEMMIYMYADLDAEHLKQKIALGANVLRYSPVPQVAYRQAFFLAMDGQLDQAKQLFEQAIWSYPGNAAVHRQLVELAEKDPAHFSALLEFANQKEQEHARAVHQQ